jgi:hypothetical protein
VAYAFELFRARDVADGIALGVLRRFQRRSTLEGDHFETSRSQLLRQDTAHRTDPNDANIGDLSIHDWPGFFGNPSQVTGGRSTTLLM